MDMIQRLLAATRAGNGEITIGPATVRAPLVRYQAEEEPDVRDLYLHTYPARTAIPLCDSDEWAKFTRWAATHDDCRELNRFAEDGCTDPNGTDVSGLRKEIREAMDRVDDSEGIGEIVHRIGKEIMDAAGETVEGLVVSDQRPARYAADWRESEHPRDEEGKFVYNGGTTSSAGAESIKAEGLGDDNPSKGDRTGGSTPPTGASWNISQAEWDKSAISPEQAAEQIAKIRAGDSRSKNKGDLRGETIFKPQVITDIPLSAIPPEVIQDLRETTNPKRVAAYSAEKIDTPVVLIPRRTARGKEPEGFGVSDGGHRIMAAIQRGDSSIRAFVPVDAYEQVKKAHGG